MLVYAMLRFFPFDSVCMVYTVCVRKNNTMSKYSNEVNVTFHTHTEYILKYTPYKKENSIYMSVHTLKVI